MPVKSEKQRRFMYASLAGKTDVPPSVAKKFVGPKAHFDGGAVKETEMMRSGRPGMGLANPRAAVRNPRMSGGPEPVGKGFAKGGGIESKGKTKGKMVKMKSGGSCK